MRDKLYHRDVRTDSPKGAIDLKCSVTYLKHSGFSVRTDAHELLFDYIGDGFVRGGGLPVIALASHAHGDHYLPDIQSLADACVLGEGIGSFAGAKVMKPGDTAEILGAKVSAFGSTDEGVSFLVESGGMRIFHAGDLNFWHWREESTEEEIREMLDAFEAVLKTLDGRPVDLAFFPVDARMGAGHDEGADMYIERISPKVLIPMHWWGRPEVAEAYERKHAGGAARVIAMTEPGSTIDLF